MVLAESRALAEDAARAGRGGLRAAARAGATWWRPREPGAPVLHPAWGDNVGARTSRPASATSRRAFRAGRRAGARALRRSSATSACRSRRAAWSPSGIARDGEPHHLERHPGRPLRPAGAGGRARAARRTRSASIAPDVGGGFGTKANGYPEDLLIPAAAIAGAPAGEVDRGPPRAHDGLGARARTRCTTSRSRARRDGTMLAVRDRIWVDLGAYNSWGIVLPYNTVAHLLGPHRVREPRRRVPRRGDQQDAERALSRRGPPRDRVRDGPHRGLPGARARAWTRPSCAGATTSSAADLPYELRHPVSRRQPARLRQRRLPRRPRGRARGGRLRRPARGAGASCASAGIHRGIGISGYVEGTAIGPYEGATVRLDASGRAVVATGAC